MRQAKRENLRGKTNLPLRAVVMVAMIVTTTLLCGRVQAQMNGVQAEAARQLPAPLPKLALNGAVGETKGRIHYHRIVLMITNWDRYSSEMFLLPVGRKLPPNPCAEVATRVAISVYSERGSSLAGCIAMPKPADLGRFSFLIQKGNPVPDFVYVVIRDRYTGAAYRSNLVSPSNGATK